MTKLMISHVIGKPTLSLAYIRNSGVVIALKLWLKCAITSPKFVPCITKNVLGVLLSFFAGSSPFQSNSRAAFSGEN